MKKTLVALAALAATSAFAQSTVEIYGIVDVGYTNHKINDGTNTHAVTRKVVGSSGQSTSRLGFRGTEDLGGGNKAGFTFETELSPAGTTNNTPSTVTNGANTLSTFQNRQAFVSLSSATAGTVAAGRQYSPQHVIQAAYNAGGANNVVGDVTYTQPEVGATEPTNGISGLRANAVSTAAYKIRFSNAVSYVAPTLVPGLTLAGATVMGTTSNNGTDAATKGGALLAKYDQGPLSLGLGMTQATIFANTVPDVANGVNAQGGTQAETTKLNDTVLGASYAIANYNLFYTHTDLKLATTATSNSLVSKRVASKVGVNATFGNWVPFAQYGTATTTSDTATTEQKNKAFQLGTSYNFSKRTNAYAIYGSNKATDFSTADLTKKETQYAIGLRHQF